jgi:hypothetical protein
MSKITIFKPQNPGVFYGMIDDATVLDTVDKFRIALGHNSGYPVLEYYCLKAIISKSDEIALRNLGIK